jgi:porin
MSSEGPRRKTIWRWQRPRKVWFNPAFLSSTRYFFVVTFPSPNQRAGLSTISSLNLIDVGRHLFISAVILGTIPFVYLAPLALADPAQLPAPPTAPSGGGGLLNQKYLLGDFNKARSNLEDDGCIFTPIYTGETFGNPIGGAKQGVIYEGLLDLELTLDFKKMVNWDGSFHVSSYYPMGNGLTGSDTHDLLVVSNIDAYDTLHLFELWYEQKFWNDKAALRIGQMGADTEFFISTGAANFLAGTYGWPGLLASDAPTPNYAYGAPGVRLRLDPDEHWAFLGAVFAGNPAPDRLGDPNPNRAPDDEYNNSGTGFYINGSQGLFGINELWYNLNKEKNATGLPGTYKIGGWFHTDTFSNKRYDDHGVPLASSLSDGHPEAVDGNNGFYVVADQALWQDKSDPNQTRETDLFFRAGNALGDRSVFDYYLDGGITFNGLIPGRPGDLFGVATAYGHIGSGLQGYAQDENSFDGTNMPIPDFEQNIELTYFAQIAPWLSVQPDLQIIIHPGGSSAIPNAVVFGVRSVINF